MHFSIRQGLDLKIEGSPRQAIENGPEVSTVALCGADFPGVRPKFSVEPGQVVLQGETLFVDRHRPDIAFTAPVAGVVERIDRSTRGSFDYLAIQRDAGGARSFDLSADVREVMLTSGLWPSLTARPFGRIPDADAVAEAILVTAMDSNPLAADPAVVVSEARQEFQEGLQVLTRSPAIRCFRRSRNASIACGSVAAIPPDCPERMWTGSTWLAALSGRSDIRP
jgi:Na+-transporting NADH:ubiquinone oxidoreductase subunit A